MEPKDKINALLAKVRPYIQTHGGDVHLLEIKDSVAIMKVEGSCVGCPLAELTYNKMIRTLITEDVPGIDHVIFE